MWQLFLKWTWLLLNFKNSVEINIIELNNHDILNMKIQLIKNQCQNSIENA